jgi:hypothetical protein
MANPYDTDRPGGLPADDLRLGSEGATQSLGQAGMEDTVVRRVVAHARPIDPAVLEAFPDGRELVCPKCGGAAHSTSYHTPDCIGHPHVEHLVWTCDRCGFARLTVPMDAPVQAIEWECLTHGESGTGDEGFARHVSVHGSVEHAYRTRSLWPDATSPWSAEQRLVSHGGRF